MVSVDLVSYPPITFAGISRQCKVEDLPKVIPAVLGELMGNKQVKFIGAPRVYYREWQDGGGRATIGFPVAPGTTLEGVDVEEMPGGDAYRAIWPGPYSEMMTPWNSAMETADANFEWCRIGLGWEDYVEPEPPVTHIYVAVEKRCTG